MANDTINFDVPVVLTPQDMELFCVLHAAVNEGPEDDFCVRVSAALLDLMNRYEMSVNRENFPF